MYGIFTSIYHKNRLNVDKYTIPMGPMGDPSLTKQIQNLRQKKHVALLFPESDQLDTKRSPSRQEPEVVQCVVCSLPGTVFVVR